jgi:hypothetical protein
LLLLHQPGHLFHLVVHPDHGGESRENPICNAYG